MDGLIRARWHERPPRLGSGDERVTQPASVWSAWARPALVALALAAAACRPGVGSPTPPAAPGEWRDFAGSWNAAGHRHTIPLGADRRGAIIDLSGTMLLAGPGRPGVGFRAEVVALADSATGLVGRSVWTDERGDQVFSELTGEGTAAHNHIAGTLLGGTGRYAGVTGTYEFSWHYVLEAEDGAIQGSASGLTGHVRLGPPPAGGAPS
jgi:hypothetical protein